MPFSYCVDCDAELEEPPTLRQVLQNSFYCYCCGVDQGIDPTRRGEGLEELLDRLEAVEAKIAYINGE